MHIVKLLPGTSGMPGAETIRIPMEYAPLPWLLMQLT